MMPLLCTFIEHAHCTGIALVPCLACKRLRPEVATAPVTRATPLGWTRKTSSGTTYVQDRIEKELLEQRRKSATARENALNKWVAFGPCWRKPVEQARR